MDCNYTATAAGGAGMLRDCFKCCIYPWGANNNTNWAWSGKSDLNCYQQTDRQREKGKRMPTHTITYYCWFALTSKTQS